MAEKLLTPTQIFTLKVPTDLNTCLPGIYRVDPSKTKNSPTDGYGLLINAEDSDSSMITQIFFGIGGGSNSANTIKIYRRNKFLTLWGNWASY